VRSEYISHQSRIRAEQEAQIEATTFAFTLTDEGPDHTNQPSKLFTSRDEFQNTTRDHLPDLSAPISAEDLLDAFGRLSLNDEHAPPSTMDDIISDGAGTLSNTQIGVASLHHNPRSPPLRRRKPSPPRNDLSRAAKSKQERNNRTTKALGVLDAIATRIDTCMEKLAPPVSYDTLDLLETELRTLRSALERVKRSTESVLSRRYEVNSRLENLGGRVVEIRNIMPEASSPVSVDAGKQLRPFLEFIHILNCLADHHYDCPVDRTTELAQVALFLGAVCSVIMGASRRAGDIVMGVIHILLRLAFKRKDGHIDAANQHVLDQIPFSLQQVLSRYNLDGRTVIYAVCPSCHCTYKPRSSGTHYPERCTNKPKPESGECNAPLLEDDQPIKTFVYHEFQDYLAGLLSRKDIEEVMDKACDDLKESLDDRPEFVKGVFEAEFLHNFEGHEEGKLFIDRGDEGRYAFALNVDFFNVEGMRIRGATTSCGVISMACLNLPLDIRYKPENLYLVGIIPGPFEPHLTELNHYLRPLIDDMVPAFERGHRLSRTAKYQKGRVVRSAIIAVVNDLVAARKASQFSPPKSHYYCSCCHCWHLDTLGRTDFDHEDWQLLDKDVLREYAEKWKNASSSTEQEKLFVAHGLRYSELWRLRYWDPPRMLVADPMHCILEGLAQLHTRKVLCLTTAAANAKPIPAQAFIHDFRPADNSGMQKKNVNQVKAIHKLLLAAVEGSTQSEIEASLTALKKELTNKRVIPLKYVCDDLELHPASRGRILKAHYVNAFIEWVSAKGLIRYY
jgi:hypothetical protein